eukprot:jgi/Chlat1/1445/Chrsp12S00104
MAAAAVEMEVEDVATFCRDDTSINQEKGLLRAPVVRPSLLGDDRTVQIYVLDESGSMSGNAWAQIQSAVRYIAANTAVGQRVHFVTYSTHAIERTAEEVCENFDGGMTSFPAAFEAIQIIITNYRTANTTNVDKFAITFMTDGCDTSSQDVPAATRALHEALTNPTLHAETVVHTIGFSAYHNLQFLEDLRRIGTTEGFYRYADPEYASLEDKFGEVFDLVSAGGAFPIAYRLETDGELVGGEANNRAWVHADVHVPPGQKGWLEVWLPAGVVPSRITLRVPVAADSNKKDATAGEVANNSEAETHTITMPVHVNRADGFFRIKRIEHEAQKPDLDEEELERLQARLSAINVFKAPKAEREDLAEARSTTQAQLNALHKMRAELSRGSAAAAAVSADLRYAAVFSKARRARAMDVRVTRNARRLAGDTLEQRVEAAKARAAQEEDSFSQCGDFVCDVSGMSARECVEDGDVLGVGIRVGEGRGEHVVDAPTELRVEDFTPTLLSRKTFELATRYKLSLAGHASTHAGFTRSKRDGGSSFNADRTDFGADDDDDDDDYSNEASVPNALVGRAREPIDAWLPLFVCPAHYEMADVWLESSLGYLFTLDPLGYQDAQLLGLYSILGQMHAHLRVPVNAAPAQSPSQRALLILREYTRLCTALLPRSRRILTRIRASEQQEAVDKQVQQQQAVDLVDAFVASAAGRTRAAVPVLSTAAGWYATTKDESGEGVRDKDEKFALLMLEESIRRRLSRQFTGASRQIMWEHIRVLLYGNCEMPQAVLGRETAADSDGKVVKSKGASKAKDKAFADWAWFKVGKTKKEAKCPELESLSLGKSSDDSSARVQLQPEHTDAVVEAKIKELWELGHDAYLARAFSFPDLEGDTVRRKALLVHSLRYFTNGIMNEALEEVNNGASTNASASNSNPQQQHNKELSGVLDPLGTLQIAHDVLQEEEKLREEAKIRERQVTHQASLAVYSDDIWAFAGRLMAMCPTRGGLVFDKLVGILQHPPHAVPLHADKIQLVLLGRIVSDDSDEEVSVLSEGNAWRMPQGVEKGFEKAIGADAMGKIMLLRAGRVARHIYRGYPGDIPNRHGYCNSKPSRWALGLEA